MDKAHPFRKPPEVRVFHEQVCHEAVHGDQVLLLGSHLQIQDNCGFCILASDPEQRFAT